MATRLQLRRDTAANWTATNPILLEGEMAVETDTGKFKVGDGITIWTSLTYSSGIQGGEGADGADGATWLSGTVDPTTEGVDGDFYLNTISYDVFKKVTGSWGTALLNIKGATGTFDDEISYIGNAGKVLKVNIAENGIELGDLATNFLELTDTPSTYTNLKGRVPTINSDENALEFVTPFTVSTEDGVLVEGFETGAPSVFPVTEYKTTGTQTVVTTEAFEGAYSYQIYIDDYDDYNYAIFTIDMTIAGDLQFYYKTTIEQAGYSGSMKVFIDDIEVFTTSGEVLDWTLFTQYLAIGVHELKVGILGNTGVRKRYVYIDNISIPAGLTYSQGIEEHSNMDSIEDNPDKILVSKVDGTGLEFIPKTTYMKNLSDGTLPTASEDYRGQIFTLLGGTGVADITYICQKDVSDVYVWVTI